MSAPKTLMELHREQRDADKALNDAIAERFADKLVHVRWGDNEVAARVIQTSPWGRVEVRSVLSGKEYWVEANRLVEYETW